MTADPVREDPDLGPRDKETIVRFGKDQERMTVFSEEKGVMNRLLHHPHFEEVDRRTHEGAVVALRGTLPVACLSIKGVPRQNTQHARVVSEGVLPHA